MSRLAHAKPATRPSLKARLMVSGPAGSGKTYSALEIATALGERILVIDTEKESALTYADDFDFTHLPWAEPYEPRELAGTLAEASKEYDVIIVDSLTHFWSGPGGILDIADGKFGGWKVARPAQQDLVRSILDAACHVIVCVRSAIAHVQEKDDRTGKQIVKKLGMEPQQDKTLEYELNLAVEIDIEHRIAVSKSRTTAVPVGRMFAPGHARDLGVEYAAWLGSGEAFADHTERMELGRITSELSKAQQAELGDLWREFSLPKVALLTVSQAEKARELINQITEGAA